MRMFQVDACEADRLGINATVYVANVWRFKLGILVLKLAGWILRARLDILQSGEEATPAPDKEGQAHQ
jgi:hypothetical protein